MIKAEQKVIDFEKAYEELEVEFPNCDIDILISRTNEKGLEVRYVLYPKGKDLKSSAIFNIGDSFIHLESFKTLHDRGIRNLNRMTGYKYSKSSNLIEG